ncbi:MAG: phospho-N-acetylmuramoyl-pentapeptide-transferase [Leptospiraceae bacterium]|nr:phospho-N-acetylmuramoyl-pentapeptide-transferase [Leptospiraceae bacterium]MDW7976583.1 phospho-N-acetylmuramoyl-pentapeptide-transferase [Leptospiraceae bacterium]
MFEYIYTNFDVPGYFRIFGYVSFRAVLAGLTSMLIVFITGDRVILWLKKLKFGETIRDDGPKSHQSKAGTPTMGGILILFSLTVSSLLFGNFDNIYFNLLLYCTILLGFIGFWDDYTKVVLKNKNGLRARTKLLLTLIVATFFLYVYYTSTPTTVVRENGITYNITSLFIPFLKNPVWTMPLWVALLLWYFAILGTIHGVNLTDGLDGLAIGNVSIATITLGAFAYLTGTPRIADYLNIPYVQGAHEIAVFLSALAGAGIGFLWFNAPPAQVFMGDTGSLALGGALGMTIIIIKKEILFLVLGGVFLVEALSVIIQVVSFKLTGKRVFKMAPIHHHFELSGWPETRVVIRFWLIGIILSLIAISTLRLQ